MTDRYAKFLFFFMAGVLSTLAVLFFLTPHIGNYLAADRSYAGFYFGNGFFWCVHEYSCLHELGHVVDEQLGYPSRSPEFQGALETYVETLPEDCSYYPVCGVAEFPGVFGNPYLMHKDNSWGGYKELYAELYAQYRMTTWIPDEKWVSFFIGMK